MNNDTKTKNKSKENQQALHLTPAIEERLRIIASVIVERIIEDQQKGSLRFKIVQGK